MTIGHAKPFTLGKFRVVSGPVESDKTSDAEIYLNTLRDSGYSGKFDGSNGQPKVLAVRHPRDDKDPENIGRHKVLVTDSVDEIYGRTSTETGTIIIAGASFFDASLVNLLDSANMSGRRVIVSGLNLNENGQPFGIMPDLMALADEVVLTKGLCNIPRCFDNKATRSYLTTDGFKPICAHHFSYRDCPQAPSGSLSMSLGPMFASKSVHYSRAAERKRKAGLDVVMFKWLSDQRYGQEDGEQPEPLSEGEITLHNDRRVKAIHARDSNDIADYLTKESDVRDVFINEGQFMEGLFNLCSKLIPQGYNLHIDGLHRGYNRKGFGDIPKLMCLADEAKVYQAICKTCHHPATESHRLTKDDRMVLVGGSGEYEARCRRHLVIPGAEPSKFTFNQYDFK